MSDSSRSRRARQVPRLRARSATSTPYSSPSRAAPSCRRRPIPTPDQPGGGVWARAVGGQVDVKSTSNSDRRDNAPARAVVNTATTACANAQHENFAGVQVGADIARLNWSGWNVHLGTTAGYLGSKETDNNGFSNTFQVPFFGTYIVATKGRFFADLMVREEFYNVNAQQSRL